jgi:hypothetical protein
MACISGSSLVLMALMRSALSVSLFFDMKPLIV